MGLRFYIKVALLNFTLVFSSCTDANSEIEASSFEADTVLKVFVQSDGGILVNNRLSSLDDLESALSDANKNNFKVYYSKSLKRKIPGKITNRVLDLFIKEDIKVELFLDSLFTRHIGSD